MTGLWLVSYIVLWILFLIVAFVLISVLRNLGVIYQSMNASMRFNTNKPLTKLTVDTPVPELILRDLKGHSASLGMFRGEQTAFIVVSPHCGPCHQLLQGIGSDPAVLNDDVQRQVVLSIGNEVDTRAMVQEAGIPSSIPVLVDSEASLKSEWGVSGTPVTVIVDPSLKVVRQMIGLDPQSMLAPLAQEVGVSDREQVNGHSAGGIASISRKGG